MILRKVFFLFSRICASIMVWECFTHKQSKVLRCFELPKILGAAFWTEMEPISINIPFAQQPSSVMKAMGIRNMGLPKPWGRKPTHLSDGRAKGGTARHGQVHTTDANAMLKIISGVGFFLGWLAFGTEGTQRFGVLMMLIRSWTSWFYRAGPRHFWRR